MTDAQPTPQDIENARVRRQIADRQAEEYAEAERLALEALGPGWIPWMKLTLIDSDHHRTGNTEPAATAYKVCRGENRLTENSVYLRRMPDGQVVYADRYEPLFGELLQEPHPTRTLEVRGQQVPCPRYSLCWSALERYEPRSAEQLAAARVKRQQRAIEKEAQEHPLFAEQIRAGEGRTEKKPGGRSPGEGVTARATRANKGSQGR
jgi:hypothetical protein